MIFSVSVYVDCFRTCRRSFVQKNLHALNCYAAPRRGNEKQCLAYVSKTDTAVDGSYFEYGVMSSRSKSKNTDIFRIIYQL
jgi:hypothetical protein